MAYLPILDAELLPGQPVKASLFRRLRDNIDTGLGLFAVNMEVLAGAGNWSPPAGVQKLKVTLVGGGGAGGGTQTGLGAATFQTGGGGGGGTTVVFIVNVPAPYDGTEVYAYTVGAGGVGANDTSGAVGGTTSFGAITAPGGSGGTRRTGVPGNGGGAGAGAPELTILGGGGTYGYYKYPVDTSQILFGGYGGFSALSASHTEVGVNMGGAGSINGRNGYFPGNGGEGAACYGNSAVRAGGNGGYGTIIIEY